MRDTNILYIGTANRIKRCKENELLTNGVVLRIIRALAGCETMGENPKTTNKDMARIAKYEGEILRKIINGECGFAFVVIPLTLANKIDHPNGRTENHRDICRMVQCVLNDRPSNTDDEDFNGEVDDEREQMRGLKSVRDSNNRRKAKERHEKRTQEMTPEEKTAFEKLWERHPNINRGQEGKAAKAFVEAVRKGAKIADIEKGHLAWCKSWNWSEENEGGRYVKKLSVWLNEQMWKAKPKGKRVETGSGCGDCGVDIG